MLSGFLSIHLYWWFIALVIAVGCWRGKRERIVPALSTTYLFLILVVTVLSRSGPVIDPYGRFQLFPFWSYFQAYREGSSYIIKQIIMNYLIFVPLGILLHCQSHKVWKTVLYGFLFSFCIETTQLLCQLGLFDIDDVIGNTIGCCLGATLSHCVHNRVTKKNT